MIIIQLLEPKRNHDEEHVHILFRFVPNSDLPKVMNTFNELSKKGGENNG
ncbi:hypothetical protein ACTFOB_03865 [Bacillus cereus group sp. MYBK79-1]